jgi:hypothetical protein
VRKLRESEALRRGESGGRDDVGKQRTVKGNYMWEMRASDELI